MFFAMYRNTGLRRERDEKRQEEPDRALRKEERQRAPAAGTGRITPKI
jgi:hypothetical protein